MARFTESRIDEKNNFSETYKGKSVKIALAIIAALLLGCLISVGAYATDTDWHDNEVSEQIQAEARKQWREENGDFQPNLTPVAEREMQAYTAQKQAEINRILELKQ